VKEGKHQELRVRRFVFDCIVGKKGCELAAIKIAGVVGGAADKATDKQEDGNGIIEEDEQEDCGFWFITASVVVRISCCILACCSWF